MQFDSPAIPSVLGVDLFVVGNIWLSSFNLDCLACSKLVTQLVLIGRYYQHKDFALIQGQFRVPRRLSDSLLPNIASILKCSLNLLWSLSTWREHQVSCLLAHAFHCHFQPLWLGKPCKLGKLWLGKEMLKEHLLWYGIVIPMLRLTLKQPEKVLLMCSHNFKLKLNMVHAVFPACPQKKLSFVPRFLL